MTRVARASITVRRVIQASAEELFDAWLDAESLAQWMRPGAVTHTTASADAREGGAFEIIMHTPTERILHRGTYQRIERPRCLVFTWISPATDHTESLVSVELLVRGDATEVVVTHERLPDKEELSHVEGWTDALARLASQLG